MTEKTHHPEPIYVFVDGGNVIAVTNRHGETIGAARLIDYDNKGEGLCPVCGGELERVGAEEKIHGQLVGGHDVCPTCNYDESQDNALACSVAYHAADDTEVTS